MKIYQVYIARCSDGSLYTGFSDDPVRRCRVHNSGKGAKYTRSRLPVELVWVSEPYYDVSTALSFEWSIKKMSRKKKLKLIRDEGRKLECIPSYRLWQKSTRSILPT